MYWKNILKEEKEAIRSENNNHFKTKFKYYKMSILERMEYLTYVWLYGCVLPHIPLESR
jgi:hypothetical protein